MSKKRKQKHPAQQTGRSLPSVQTIFRYSVIDFETRQIIDQARESMGPEIWERDKDAVERIERAKTADELLDLANVATGMAEPTWYQRVRQYGGDIVPKVTARLKASRDITAQHERTLVREHLISALRWRGTLGANALQESFADLDEYAQSLAAVVLGLLHARASADLIWDLYQRTKQNPESYFIGALWALIDFGDSRAADALAELLQMERVYEEMFGFIARAGDERAIIPMAALMVHGTKSDKQQVGYVLAAIAQRIGREKFLAALLRDMPAEQRQAGEQTMDMLFQVPEEVIREYFELYYHGVL